MRIRHIRDRLIIATLVLVIPFAVWNVVLQVLRLRESLVEATSARHEAAREVADAYAGYVADLVSVDRAIGMSLWDGRDAEAPQTSQYLSELTRGLPRLAHLAAANPEGIIVASDVSALVGVDISRFCPVETLRQGRNWTVSRVFTPSEIGIPVVAVITAIRDSQEQTLGMIIGFTDEHVIAKSLPAAVLHPGMLLILDSTGTVVLEHGGPTLALAERHWGDMAFVRRALDGEATVVDRLRMPNGEIMMGAAVPIREIGWAVVTLTPREEVIGPIRRQILPRALAVLLVGGIVIGMAVYLGNKLSSPIMDLAGTARRLGAGRLNERADVSTGDEVQFLATTFNDMADSLEQRTAQLNEALDAQRRQSDRASSLYSIAQGLVVTMDLHERLEVIARALGSICNAKRCIIFLKRGSRLVGAAGWGLQRPESITHVSIRMPEELTRDYQTATSGAPIVVPDTEHDPYIEPGMAKRFNVEGYLALPLVRRDHIVGMAVLDTPGEPPRFNDKAIHEARGLGTLASIAIENAEAFEKWLHIAQAFQTSLLPEAPPATGRFRYACKYAAAMEMAELGGDFYDFVPFSDGRMGLIIADVSGKGLEAAVSTAMGKYTFRAYMSENPSPDLVLTRANEALLRNSGNWTFITTFYGLLDPKTGILTYANAGHPPVLLVRAEGGETWLPREGQQIPLGSFERIEYARNEVRMKPGDVLVGYTDGVTEARRDGDMFDTERLVRTARDSIGLAPDGIAEAIHKAVLDFSRGRLQDDIALLIAKYEGV